MLIEITPQSFSEIIIGPLNPDYETLNEIVLAK
jgi:hypothetical protein